MNLNLPLGSSPLVAAHAAKHGIVVMLKAINAIMPAPVMPVAEIIAAASVTPSTPARVSGTNIPPTFAPSAAIQPARVPKVAITFSLAISPVMAATANTQPNSPSCEPNPSGVNNG